MHPGTYGTRNEVNLTVGLTNSCRMTIVEFFIFVFKSMFMEYNRQYFDVKFNLIPLK